MVLLAPDADVGAVVKAIDLAGGHITHIFPPDAMIGVVPAGIPLPPDVLSIYRQAVDPAILAEKSSNVRRVAQIWNAFLLPGQIESLDDLEAELAGDALEAPPPAVSSASQEDLEPGYMETSEYMIGRVAVGIVLPESSGEVDASTEDWADSERLLVLSEIAAALNWWAAREPGAHLTFVYDDGAAAPVLTGYEPIGRSMTDQGLWISEVMRRKGYTGSLYFDQVRQYNNALRDIYDTDWAFTIFVVDSSADADRRFADGYFAYAYLQGPFMVMAFGNNGYGPQNMDAVAAHEVGHVFGALDQYASAQRPCSQRGGYLGIENQNSQYGTCASNAPSIMRGQVAPYTGGSLDEYAREQVGWHDSDGDGVLDPVDTVLSIADWSYAADPNHPDVLAFTGRVQDDPYPSSFRRSTIINTIVRVQYRVNGTAWVDAQPTDGLFDSYIEGFNFITKPLPAGNLVFDLRVADSASNELIQLLADVLSDSFTVPRSTCTVFVPLVLKAQ